MGYVCKGEIEKGGAFLFKILLQGDGTVDYSSLYDGTTERSERLAEEVCGEKDPWVSPELLINLAAEQLEAQGLVKLTSLDSKLDDGETDYRIELTELGRSAGRPPHTFRDMDL